MTNRANFLVLATSVVLLTLSALSAAVGQQPNGVDLDKAILGQIKEAYKAPYEVPQDLRDELRGYYKNPTPQREAAILKEVRRLYAPTAQQEQAILYEVRKAYERWSPEQEVRIYRAVEKTQRLPEGSLGPTVLANQVSKLFAKLDRDSDGVLSAAELTEALRNERFRWDANRDGLLSPEEFGAYYQGRLGWLSEQVATGKIDLGLKRGGPNLSKIPQPDMILVEEDEARPIVYRTGKLPTGLPAWFVQLDTNKDGQIALYEWREGRKALADFSLLDRNDDGFATIEEVLRYTAQISSEPGVASSNSRPASIPDEKKAKQRK